MAMVSQANSGIKIYGFNISFSLASAFPQAPTVFLYPLMTEPGCGIGKYKIFLMSFGSHFLTVENSGKNTFVAVFPSKIIIFGLTSRFSFSRIGRNFFISCFVG